MPLALGSLFLGFVLGVVASAIAWALSLKTARPNEKAKVTALWDIKDIVGPNDRPAVVAEHISAGVLLPAHSKVIVPTSGISQVPPQILATCEVRMHDDVRMNAAIGKDRVLMFSGHMSPKAHAVVTTEHTAVRRLQNDFERMWGESSPYVERAEVSALATKDGRHVDVTGRAMDVLEYRGRKMLRLTDGKAQVGVVTRQDDVAQFAGTTIRVVGRMHRDGGHAYIEADKVTQVGEPAQARAPAPAA